MVRPGGGVVKPGGGVVRPGRGIAVIDEGIFRGTGLVRNEGGGDRTSSSLLRLSLLL